MQQESQDRRMLGKRVESESHKLDAEQAAWEVLR